MAPSAQQPGEAARVGRRRWTQSPVRRLSAGWLALLVVLLGGCADDDALVVSAASSLSEAFTELAAAFEEEHGVEVALNLGSSSALAVQIVEGAPVDVFASANPAQMQVVEQAGRVDEATAFSRNALVVVVPTGRGEVAGFEDLAAEGVSLVLAGPEVPIGAYARQAIAAADANLGTGFEARVLANVVSEEANVRAVLTKVELGEADAGIVYATDAAVAGDAVEAYSVPMEYAPPVEYVVAVLEDAGGPAQAFVDYLLSDAGRAILDRHGFIPVDG